MKEIIVFALAKINLGLLIKYKRNDGFHEIESIFQEINFSDKLKIKKSNRITFKSNSIELKKSDTNLCVVAAKLLQKEFGIDGLDIVMEKRIPIGSGLGGGSSDAAAVINTGILLYNLQIPNQKMVKIAEQIGSDVPFFLNGKTAHISGRGEIINKIKLNIDYYVLLVFPQLKISTAEAYKSLGMYLTRNDNAFKFTSSNLLKLGVRNFKKLLVNDFEDSVFEKYPDLLEIKNLLYREHAEFASLSGSGSTLYGIYSTVERVQKAYNKLSKLYSCFIAIPVY